ncbi:MAG: Cof-type HAD-IIB family hydrolase [Anaerolineaceae bacterium]|nr:Cof-type HAD-IIB family hydrolase [Anaerolineaceae bacterium]
MNSYIDISQYKLVISDLDGTILESGQPIHPFTKEVLAKLPGFGLRFTLASGRSLASLRPYAEELNINIPLVLANGCIVQSLDGVIHHRTTMPVEVTRKVIEITDKENSDLVIFSDDRLFYKKMTDNIFRIFGKLNNSIIEVGSWDAIESLLEQVNKFMIIDWQSQENLKRLENIFESELSGQANYLRTNFNHLEVMPKGVTKATGLKQLVEGLDIRMDEIIAFGDFENDAAMLAEVGLGVAVENACDHVKQNADLIVGSCAENGPAVFLNQLISQN